MANEDVPYDPGVQAENIPLYLFMIVYLLAIAGVGLVAKKWKDEAMKQGYTVVGVPDEARASGFYAVRWVNGITCLPLTMAIFWPRLRRLYKVRGYSSPNDFIADRYRSKSLTFLGSLCTCLPQLFYLTVQLVSFAALLNGLTGGAVTNNWAMLLFVVIVLTLERIGGMNSVILSDGVQAGLMMVGFVSVFLVVLAKYGSLATLGSSTCTTSWANTSFKELEFTSPEETPPLCDASLMPNGDCTEFGCISAAMFANGQGKAGIFWFMFNFIAFPLNPHMMQRACIAKTDDDVKTVMQMLCWASYLAMIPGIILGITVAVMSPSWPLASSSAGALAALQTELKKDGAWQYALVSILTCSALAAIMSTADSVILGVSNALSIDIYKGMLKPQATAAEVVNFGNWVSLSFTGAALVAGLFITSDVFGALLMAQNAFILQIVPTFFLGLYFQNVPTKALLMGLGVSISSIGLMYLVFPLLGVALPASLLAVVPEANIAVLLNFSVTALALLAGVKDSDDEDAWQESVAERFGAKLNMWTLREAMGDGKEASVGLQLFTLLLLIISFPWFFDITDSESWAGTGWPFWSIYGISLAAVGSATMTAAFFTWKPGAPPAEKRMGTMELELENHFARPASRMSTGLI